MEKSDFLVVGAGISVLLFALEAAKKGRVNILTKRELNEGNTRFLHRFADEGMIDITRTEFNVTDKQRLQDMAGNVKGS